MGIRASVHFPNREDVEALGEALRGLGV